MKFFWKLYFSIMAITLTCFSVGGYMLIQSSFDNSLKREIDSVYQENDILVNSLSLELSVAIDGQVADNSSERYWVLGSMMSDIKFETFRGSIFFCIRDQDGKLIYQIGDFSDDAQIVKEVSQNERGYIINKEGSKYSLRCVRVFTIASTDLYIENTHDISELFLNRETQFQTLLYYTVILSLASAVLIFIIARWLVKPIKTLSNATKTIVSGASVEPVVVHSDDEIGQLTKDFNTMTARLKEMMDELQEAVDRQEVFVGNFAHELKTPLTSIIGYADMLRCKRLSEEEIINYSNLVFEEGKRLETMSMKLMDLIVLKKQDFKLFLVEAKRFLEGIGETVSLLMKEHQIDFIVDVEEGMLYIEPDLMKTVCLNLLDNARKAVDEGGRIVLKGVNSEDGYQIIVDDNGYGIAKEELSKIKEAFYMVDKSRARSSGGAGLGLAISQQIIDLHQATIDFKSELNKGTTVTVTLKGVGANDEKI